MALHLLTAAVAVAVAGEQGGQLARPRWRGRADRGWVERRKGVPIIVKFVPCSNVVRERI